MASRKADDLEQIVSTIPMGMWMVYQQPKKDFYSTIIVFVRADTKASAIREAKKGDHFSNERREFKHVTAIMVTPGLVFHL